MNIWKVVISFHKIYVYNISLYLIDQKHSDSTVWFYSDLVYLKNEKISSMAGVGKYSEKLRAISKIYSCFNTLDSWKNNQKSSKPKSAKIYYVKT